MRRRHAALAAVGLVAGCAHRETPPTTVHTAMLAPLADETAPVTDPAQPTTTTSTTTTTTAPAPVYASGYTAPYIHIPSTVAPAGQVEQSTTGGVSVSVTAYCEPGTMADGNHTHPGAAAGNRWPFGTRITVPGWGTVTVEDRIGSGSDLDLFMPSCAQAVNWGRRRLTVQVAA